MGSCVGTLAAQQAETFDVAAVSTWGNVGGAKRRRVRVRARMHGVAAAERDGSAGGGGSGSGKARHRAGVTHFRSGERDGVAKWATGPVQLPHSHSPDVSYRGSAKSDVVGGSGPLKDLSTRVGDASDFKSEAAAQGADDGPSDSSGDGGHHASSVVGALPLGLSPPVPPGARPGGFTRGGSGGMMGRGPSFNVAPPRGMRPPAVARAVASMPAQSAVPPVENDPLRGPDYGFARGFERAFELGDEIGRGGYGRVYRAVATGGIAEVCVGQSNNKLMPVQPGTEVAIKMIPKLPATLLRHVKAARRIGKANREAERSLRAKAEELREDILREVRVLRKLRGTLSVAHMYGVYEDDEHVYIPLELCTGGEVLHRLGLVSYTEAEVARIMRAVFRTLAQCHENSILHLDIKPGNFLFETDAPDARVKAVDFGLASFYTPGRIESMPTAGTAWFMAPELLRSEVGPAADVWAAGVMLFQLLSGRFPFNDRRNPLQPSLSMVWRSILEDDIEEQLKKDPWPSISEEAKDLVRQLLSKDPLLRPSAGKALQNIWVRAEGAPELGRSRRVLGGEVVQRLQRFATKCAFRQTVLQMMVSEMTDCEEAGPKLAHSHSAASELFDSLDTDNDGSLSFQDLKGGLIDAGYDLNTREVEFLMPKRYPPDGMITREEVVAALLPADEVLRDEEGALEAAAARVFRRLDSNSDGLVSVQTIEKYIENSLHETDVMPTIQAALVDAGLSADCEQMSLESFLTMVRTCYDPVETYDARLQPAHSAQDALEDLAQVAVDRSRHNTPESSLRGGTQGLGCSHLEEGGGPGDAAEAA